jgi:RES domain-containing protein
LEGSGGEKFSSRWTSRGHRVVYMAESPAGAMLEVLAHAEFEDGELPDQYQLLAISVPGDLAIRKIDAPRRRDWRERADLTQRIGDTWIRSHETPLARVPSAIMPRTWNHLLNPFHSDARRIKIQEVIRERFDNRLFRFGGR